ncbi:hypothetical protein PHMEG_0007292 [Phytophthora megakarya]|uniref:Uncharacterized protein n=1 Tax=Phytophthora megakarya TaxID=4795 RepID=A0A225WN69_9STRA|nr:hypothetical protein PHMEG_0007292 [Phytophthora megakarya]
MVERFKLAPYQKWKWVERYVAARNKNERIDYENLSTKREFKASKGHGEELEKHEESILRRLKLAYEGDCARKTTERELRKNTCPSSENMVEVILDAVRGEGEETRESLLKFAQEEAELKGAALQLASTRYHLSPSSVQAQDTAAQMPRDGSESEEISNVYDGLKTEVTKHLTVHLEKATQKVKKRQMHYKKRRKQMTEIKDELKKALA